MLAEFLSAIPDSTRRFFRHELSDAARVERWCSTLDFTHYVPILAWNGDQIVADATLQREPGLWTAHIGKLRLLVHPRFQRRGIGSLMVQEIVEVAQELGLHKLVHECAADQVDLTSLLEKCGYSEVARLPDFVRDHNGALHDMVMMARSLE
jgi:RimJ/RimL family protein N-acetyltransferase